MIRDPFLLFFIFSGLVCGLYQLEKNSHFKKWFSFFPLPLWCYLLPMAARSVGLVPAASPLYDFLSQWLLPFCLVLLLAGTDVKALRQMGPLAAILMFIGAFGTMSGGLISYKVLHRWMPNGSWGGIGALSASWIGGSANMMAVKESLRVPDSILGSLIIVDAVVAYSWMGLLIWASAWQQKWNQWIYQERPSNGLEFSCRLADPPSRPALHVVPRSSSPVRPEPVEGLGNHGRSGLTVPSNPNPSDGPIILASFITVIAHWGGHHLPSIDSIFTSSTWTIVIVTTASLGLSLIPFIKKMAHGSSSRIGTFFLYLLLASIGARGNFSAIFHAPVYLLMGVLWIAIHGFVLLSAGYLLKAPLGLIASASQANIGGTISAPLVGAAYHPQLAGMALLMAILGNILGTYLGLLTAACARLIC